MANNHDGVLTRKQRILAPATLTATAGTTNLKVSTTSTNTSTSGSVSTSTYSNINTNISDIVTSLNDDFESKINKKIKSIIQKNNDTLLNSLTAMIKKELQPFQTEIDNLKIKLNEIDTRLSNLETKYSLKHKFDLDNIAESVNIDLLRLRKLNELEMTGIPYVANESPPAIVQI